MKVLVLSFLLFLAVGAQAQERVLLPPAPPMRNPMLLPDKTLPLPPSLGGASVAPVVEPEAPGWILRRNEAGAWRVLWQGRWLGKNQMLGNEKIITIDEFAIEVRGPAGKRTISILGPRLGRQQQEYKP